MLITPQLPGRTIWIEGQERLYFSGTSYLGMGHSEAFRELLHEGVVQYGTIYSSSRASNVQLAIYEEAEEVLASVTGAEAALTFSSGFQAGQAAVQSLAATPTFCYAPHTHPAVWRNPSDAVYGDFAVWTSSVADQVAAAPGDVVIVANSLDPLRVRPYSFNWVADLPQSRPITLLVDDSHGLGITGENGEGIFATLKSLAPSNVTVVVISSLGKAYGMPGGVVLGPQPFVSYLRKMPFFTAGSPMPPAYLSAFTRAQPLYQRARQQLFTSVSCFRQQTNDLSIFRSQDRYPVFYTSDNSLAPAVAPQAVLSSFSYPHPESDPITRVIVSSLHTEADLDILEALVREYVHQKNNLS